MIILGMDTSSQSASCALVGDGVVLGEFFTNVRLTHSQTIMPMLENLLTQTRVSLSEVDVFAVTTGPGSFTGLRIGLSAVKGMAHALDKSCVGVSTLEALAWNLKGQQGIIVPVLDARCGQVYTAQFCWQGETLCRLKEDEALSLQDLSEQLEKIGQPVFFVGDGAQMCYNNLNERLKYPVPPLTALTYVRGSSVALAAWNRAQEKQTVSPAALAPAYLRLPQAERELLARKSKKDLEMESK